MLKQVQDYILFRRDLILSLVFAILSICIVIGLTIVTVKEAIILLTIALSITFSYAWDKGKKYSNSGSISGNVILPLIPMNYQYGASLKELYGEKRYYKIRFHNNNFKILGLDPGKYDLEFSGTYLTDSKFSLELYSKSSIVLDKIHLQAYIGNVWHKLQSPAGNSSNFFIDPTGGMWLSVSDPKTYGVIFYHKPVSTQEWVIYTRDDFFNLLDSMFRRDILYNALSLQGIGRQVALKQISNDQWKIAGAMDENFIGGIKVREQIILVFLKDRISEKTIISRSSDDGASWETTAEIQGVHTNIKLLSLGSNRLVIYTETLSSCGAKIYYSDDLGGNWLPAIISLKNPIRGFLSVLQLKSGELIAGTQSGDGWKGDFYKSTVILRSKDSGGNWEISHELKGLKSYHDFWESSKGIIYGLLWPISNMAASFDKGFTWHIINNWPSNNALPSLQHFRQADGQLYAHGLSGVYYTDIENLNLDCALDD